MNDKELSNDCLFKTSYDLRVDRHNYKREQQKIEFIDKTRQTKINTITALKALRASENMTLNASKNDLLRTKLL